MSEVTRYEDGECGLHNMSENETGPWVKYEDYAKLKAQLDALVAENAGLKFVQKGLVKLINEHIGDTILTGDEMKTPATDAYLNSVRADAVRHAGKMIFATMNHQDKGVERALECIAEVELQYTLAAQLRTGESS